MLEMMEGDQLAEWHAYKEWEQEMEIRGDMQADANTSLAQMKRGR